MRVAFLYNRSSEDPAQAAEDEVPARSPVVAALKRLGHRVAPIPCTLDLAKVRRRLLRFRPDVVFNRVESLGGGDAMMAAVTLLLDAMQVPYTGNSSTALVATASKILVKERLKRAGLPTPEWFTLGVEDDPARFDQKSKIQNPKYIIKSIYEHASYDIHDESVVSANGHEQIYQILQDRHATAGRPHFAEQFIDGREFNVSLIGPEPSVLPPAEIDFSAFPAGKHRIVGHGAKWDATSFEYQSTPRRFEFPASDERLLKRIQELSTECWHLFDLCGYARVDFRCDADGQPWILEINTNPCISPDAGFAAAMEQAGCSYEQAIQQILDSAMIESRTSSASRASRTPVGV